MADERLSAEERAIEEAIVEREAFLRSLKANADSIADDLTALMPDGMTVSFELDDESAGAVPLLGDPEP